VLQAFHADYRGFYGYEQQEEAIEIVGMIVTAIGDRTGPEARFRHVESEGLETTARSVSFPSDGFRETTIVQRDALAPGDSREGPLVVEEALSTTLVPPGCRLTVHESGSLLIDLPEAGS
jgi:N-methylhydantoinase A